MINAHNHCGDVDEAIKAWESIKGRDIKYDDYIMSIITDCMSRKGDLNQAFKFVMEYNIINEVAWISLMSGCKNYDQQEIALKIVEEMLKRFDSKASCVEASCKLFPEFCNCLVKT